MNWFWLNLSSLVRFLLFGFSLPNESTRLWYFVDVETETHRDWWIYWMSRPRLIETEKFIVCRDRDQSRLGKRCWYRDSIETLADLWDEHFYVGGRGTNIFVEGVGGNDGCKRSKLSCELSEDPCEGSKQARGPVGLWNSSTKYYTIHIHKEHSTKPFICENSTVVLPEVE